MASCCHADDRLTDAADRVAFRMENARAELLTKEKELMRMKDSVAAARRRLPMVEITAPYTFDSEHGPSLAG